MKRKKKIDWINSVDALRVEAKHAKDMFEKNSIEQAKKRTSSKAYSKFIAYAKSAHTRNRCFYLTIEDFIKINTLDCWYCGHKATGYDRVDNNIGYKRSNIVPCCIECNYMKGTFSKEKFITKIKQIHENILRADKD